MATDTRKIHPWHTLHPLYKKSLQTPIFQCFQRSFCVKLSIWNNTYIVSIMATHTSAKLIEIQQNCLSKIHILHDLGSHMESNDTLHGSELVPHWVLGPKNWKFGPMGPKIFTQKFLYTKLVSYHVAILWGFEAKIVFGANQVSNIQIPDFSLSVGQKNQIDFVSSKVVYVNG